MRFRSERRGGVLRPSRMCAADFSAGRRGRPPHTAPREGPGSGPARGLRALPSLASLFISDAIASVRYFTPEALAGLPPGLTALHLDGHYHRRP